MRVLLTGSRGFIGRHLSNQLQQIDIEWLGVKHRPGPEGSALALPSGWVGEPFTLIDLAWDTSRATELVPNVAQVQRLAALLDHLAPRGLAAVIATGSAAEYGQTEGTLDEEAPPVGPVSAYGWGKRAAGEMLRRWSERTGIRALWARPFVVYGPGQQGNMVIPYTLRQALAGQPAGLSDGAQQRDLVHVTDVVKLYTRALQRRWDGFQVLNAGTGVPARLSDVLLHLADLLGARHLLRFGAIPRRAGEPLVQVARTDRAWRVLGWRAETDWREGLRGLAAGPRRDVA